MQPHLPRSTGTSPALSPPTLAVARPRTNPTPRCLFTPARALLPRRNPGAGRRRRPAPGRPRFWDPQPTRENGGPAQLPRPGPGAPAPGRRGRGRPHHPTHSAGRRHLAPRFSPRRAHPVRPNTTPYHPTPSCSCALSAPCQRPAGALPAPLIVPCDASHANPQPAGARSPAALRPAQARRAGAAPFQFPAFPAHECRARVLQRRPPRAAPPLQNPGARAAGARADPF
jgi:hypothetical protein